MEMIKIELWRRISNLEERVRKIEEKLEDYNLNEYIRKYLVSVGLLEGAAEDE